MIKTKAKVSEIKKIGDKAFIIKLEVDKKLNQKAGQFATIFLEIDGKKEARVYSIASLAEEDFLMFYIKKVPKGKVSNHLYHLKKGDKLEVMGPGGHLTPDIFGKDVKKIIFIAAGSGISPVRPLTHWAHNNSLKTIVYHQERTKDYLVFKEEFEKISDYRPILSQENIDGIRGPYIDDYLNELIEEYEEGTYYVIVGSIPFAEKIKNFLTNKGVNEEKIKIEAYGYGSHSRK